MLAITRKVEACSYLSVHNENIQGYNLLQQTYLVYTSGTCNTGHTVESEQGKAQYRTGVTSPMDDDDDGTDSDDAHNYFNSTV